VEHKELDASSVQLKRKFEDAFVMEALIEYGFLGKRDSGIGLAECVYVDTPHLSEVDPGDPLNISFPRVVEEGNVPRSEPYH
jgi:hypothetical protein